MEVRITTEVSGLLEETNSMHRFGNGSSGLLLVRLVGNVPC